MKIQDFKQLFWDVDASDLASLEERVVISRTLSHGTFAQIRDLFALYGRDAIQTVFTTLKHGALSERRRDYFALILS